MKSAASAHRERIIWAWERTVHSFSDSREVSQLRLPAEELCCSFDKDEQVLVVLGDIPSVSALLAGALDEISVATGLWLLVNRLDEGHAVSNVGWEVEAEREDCFELDAGSRSIEKTIEVSTADGLESLVDSSCSTRASVGKSWNSNFFLLNDRSLAAEAGGIDSLHSDDIIRHVCLREVNKEIDRCRSQLQ